MLSCFQIGHTSIIHGHLLHGESESISIECGVALPVLCFLVECPCYDKDTILDSAFIAYHTTCLKMIPLAWLTHCHF